MQRGVRCSLLPPGWGRGCSLSSSASLSLVLTHVWRQEIWKGRWEQQAAVYCSTPEYTVYCVLSVHSEWMILYRVLGRDLNQQLSIILQHWECCWLKIYENLFSRQHLMEEEEKKEEQMTRTRRDYFKLFDTWCWSTCAATEAFFFFFNQSQKWHFRNLRKAIKSLLGPAYSSRDVQSVIKTAPNRHDSF